MPLTALVRQLQQVPLTGEVLERSRRPDRLRLQGASRGARALLASAMARCEGAPLLVVVPTLEEAGRWAALLELMGWPTTQLYPTSEGSPYETFDPTSEITWGQLQVLSELVDEQGDGWQGVIVATERALQPHLPPPAVLADQCLTLRKGASIDLEELAANLARLGYERVSTIEQEGSWSRRGDIVDLFPVSAELPVRLEFFGEDLEKLREFDPATQRSLDAVDLVRITPTGYGPLVADALRANLPDQLDQLLNAEAMEQLLAGDTPEGMRRLNVPTTCSVSFATVSWMRVLAAAVPPSTARNALVMATDILLSSNGTTVPLRLITRICPGAVAAIRVWLGVPEMGGVADAGLLTDSLPVCILFSPSTHLFVGLQPVH